jgi:magnesium chelatase family protein
MGVLPADAVEGHLALGELALDGSLRGVSGVLPAAVRAAARELALICPAASGQEAAWLKDQIEIVAAPSLLALLNHARGLQPLPIPEPPDPEDEAAGPDLRDVKGQETAKRALEIAAAGNHNLLMTGPPGAGKSMLASRLIGLLPPLDPAEVLEVSMIASVGGRLGGKLTKRRPYRSPHHGASMVAMVGGGQNARPGEVSLAHKGVLFLDELPEFAGIMEQTHQGSQRSELPPMRAAGYPATACRPCKDGEQSFLNLTAYGHGSLPWPSSCAPWLRARIGVHSILPASPWAGLSSRSFNPATAPRRGRAFPPLPPAPNPPCPAAPRRGRGAGWLSFSHDCTESSLAARDGTPPGRLSRASWRRGGPSWQPVLVRCWGA